MERKWVVFLSMGIFCSLSFCQGVDTFSSFCSKLKLPKFNPINSVNLKNLSDFSTVAVGWRLRSSDGKSAWGITDKSGREVYEFGFGEPFWVAWEKVLREKILFRFGQFLSDGEWHFLYRGLCGYGMAVKKGMTIRIEGRNLENWGEGREDGVWRGSGKISVKAKGDEIFFIKFKYPSLPTLRSTHATSIAMWAIGEGLVSEKEPYQAVIGSISGLITRCLCDLPEKPFVHEIERGLPLFLKLRGKSGKVETFLLSETPWEKVKRKFLEGKVAFVTFLYRKDQRERKNALYRVDSITVLALGFWESPKGVYLITISPRNSFEKPKEIKGWFDGVTLVRLDGPTFNIVFSFPTVEGVKDGGAKAR